jgi:hypothetical protein
MGLTPVSSGVMSGFQNLVWFKIASGAAPGQTHKITVSLTAAFLPENNGSRKKRARD